MAHDLDFSEFVGFEWSGGNDVKNQRKHNVTTHEAEAVFFNSPLVIAVDDPHSMDEKRFFALGQTSEGRKLFVAFTVRGPRIRVISARDMSRQERKAYQDENNKTPEV